MADPTDNCNCCEGTAALTPASLENLPGQAALVYRVGTHGRFKETMKAAIAHQRALSGLTTRDDDDPSIALIDAWATTLDVLTFYQERIANEGYLRTATERQSILELARSIGYELRPGVAASTYLAFELETAKGSPEKATLAIGTKAQTLPGQDELPQIFETIETIEARPEWNKLKAKTTKQLLPVFGSRCVYLQSVTTQLKSGDGLLIVGKEREDNPSSERWDFRHITKVTPVNANNITLVEWAEGLGWSRGYGTVLPAAQDVKVYAFRSKAALFGHNAPDWRLLSAEARLRYQGLPASGSDTNVDPEWPGFGIALATNPLSQDNTSGLGLYGEYFANQDFTNLIGVRLDGPIDFDWADKGPASDTSNPVYGLGNNTFSIRWTGQVLAQFSETYTFTTESDDGVRLWVDGKLIIDNWKDHDKIQDAGEIKLKANQRYELKLEYYENTGSAVIRLLWSSASRSQEPIPRSRLFPAQVVFLDNVYASIIPQSWVIVSTAEYQEAYQVQSAVESARKNYSLSGKVTRLELAGENLYQKYNFKSREAVLFTQSEELLIAEAPDTSPVAAGSNSVDVQGAANNLAKGRELIVAGTDASSGDPIAELALLDRIENNGTRLVFQRKLTHSFQRAGAVIHANVAAATHGETKTEVLGSGDASQAFQKFLLKQIPITYTATDQAPSGAITTLALRVNDVLWEESPSLYGLKRRGHQYITRIGDDGKVLVEFGDGQSGARVPSGVENVQARYRVGTGLAGMVKAEQISLLMTRPLGVKGVINPIAPEGAQDPETRDQARKNAPLTVLTLDRVVSLQDFEDFTRAFSGIGKSQAVWLWDDQRAIVHITVAAANGDIVQETLQKNLRHAIESACDPTQRFMIDSFNTIKFTIQVKVKFDPKYLMDKVTAAIKKLIAESFAFERRAFGQPVTQSEVIALIQGVEGVIYVDLESFNNEKDARGVPVLRPSLVAQVAHWKKDVNGKNIELIKTELITLGDLPNSVEVIPL